MMKSFYDLDKKEASKLESEFLSSEVGRDENYFMKLQVILGIILVIISSISISIFLFCLVDNMYLFVIDLFFMIMGILLVVMATLEYHNKYNSWLEVKHKIIRK